MIRTRDLTLTKGALYRWSYGSIAIDAPDLHEFASLLQAGFSHTYARTTYARPPYAYRTYVMGISFQIAGQAPVSFPVPAPVPGSLQSVTCTAAR